MYKVMLVDDEAIEREGMRLLIEDNFDYFDAIEEAANGYEAIDLFKSFEPDIVIMDIGMPGIDGLETIRRLQQVESMALDHKLCKYIILTAHSQFKYAQEAIRIGVSDFLLKPTNINHFIDLMAGVINDIEEERHVANRALAYQNKVDSLKGVLETDCIYSLVMDSHQTKIVDLIGKFDETYSHGFVFVVKTAKSNDISKIVKDKTHKKNYLCTGEYIHGINIFLCLFDGSISNKTIDDVVAYIDMTLGIYTIEHYKIGYDDGCHRIDDLHLSYEHGMLCLNGKNISDKKLIKYFDIKSDNKSIGLDCFYYSEILFDAIEVMNVERVDYICRDLFSALHIACGTDYRCVQSYLIEIASLIKKNRL